MYTYIQAVFKNKLYKKSILMMTLFIIVNCLKTTLYNYFLIPQVSKNIFIYKFWYTLLITVIVYSVVWLFRSRYVFLAVYVVQGLFIFVNISYFLYYHSYLHFLQWISLFKEALISASHLANPTSVQLLVVFIDVPFALYILFKCYKPEFRKLHIPYLKQAILLLTLLVLLVVEIVNFQNHKSIVQYMDDRYTGETKIVETYGTFVNGALNIFKNYSEAKLIQQITYGSKITGDSATAQHPNYVVIQVESMDANIVKQQHHGQNVMPFLSSLRQNSVYYPYMLSYHKGGGTSDTEFSIINSVESLDSFPAIKLTSYNYPNSMVSKLAGENYSTMAFHGNVGTFYNRNIALSKMGFNKFYDISTMNYKDEGWGAPDDKVFSFALEKMEKAKKPFFSYIITMTSHGPFESARNYYNNENYDDIEEELVKNYFNSFNYVDNCIRDFVTEVQKKYPDTYIIIYGDHTPNLSNKDFYQASFIDVDKYLEFVPLFIITPDQQKYMENSEVASFLDIAPTVLKTSGVPYSLNSNGADLLYQGAPKKKIPLKGTSYDRKTLFDKISNYSYNENEPTWIKYLPSFISSNLIERHTK